MKIILFICIGWLSLLVAVSIFLVIAILVRKILQRVFPEYDTGFMSELAYLMYGDDQSSSESCPE